MLATYVSRSQTRHLRQPRRQIAGRKTASRDPEARHLYRTTEREPPPLDQPSALTPPSGPLAFATPIGHDTSVPWSGQYPLGFLLLERYCWW